MVIFSDGIRQFNNPELSTSIERSPISKRPSQLPLSQACSPYPTKEFDSIFSQYGHTRATSYTDAATFQQHHYYDPQKLLSLKSTKTPSGGIGSEFLTLTPKRRDRLMEQWQLDFRDMRNSSLDRIYNAATLKLGTGMEQSSDSIKVPNINTTITDKTHIVAADTPIRRHDRHQQDYTIVV